MKKDENNLSFFHCKIKKKVEVCDIIIMKSASVGFL